MWVGCRRGQDEEVPGSGDGSAGGCPDVLPEKTPKALALLASATWLRLRSLVPRGAAANDGGIGLRYASALARSPGGGDVKRAGNVRHWGYLPLPAVDQGVDALDR